MCEVFSHCLKNPIIQMTSLHFTNAPLYVLLRTRMRIPDQCSMSLLHLLLMGRCNKRYQQVTIWTHKMFLRWAQILYDYEVLTMVSIALVSSTMVIKVILIHTTCMNGEADYCHLVSMYAYIHLAFKELKVGMGANAWACL